MDLTDEMQQTILRWMETGEAFASEQIPLVAQQLVTYGLYEALIFGPIQIGLAILCFLPLYRVFQSRAQYLADPQQHPRIKNLWWDGSEPTVMGFVGIVIGGLFGFIFSMVFLFETIPTLIKIIFAPNLYILEQMAMRFS